MNEFSFFVLKVELIIQNLKNKGIILKNCNHRKIVSKLFNIENISYDDINLKYYIEQLIAENFKLDEVTNNVDIVHKCNCRYDYPSYYCNCK